MKREVSKHYVSIDILNSEPKEQMDISRDSVQL